MDTSQEAEGRPAALPAVRGAAGAGAGRLAARRSATWRGLWGRVWPPAWWPRLEGGAQRPAAPSRARPGWLVYLSLLGPGLIAASAGNDVGGIATYSAVGARYGYELLWMMVLITIAMIVVQEQCARMGAVTGKGLSDLIRERFGPRWTVLAMVCLLVANGGVTVTEFVGIGAAAELFGLSRFVVVPLVALLVWWLLVRGDYRRVEWLFLALTLVFLAYPVAAVLAGPDWGQVLHGTVVPTVRIDRSYLLLIVATVGTTITPYMQMYQQDAVVEKGLTAADLPYVRADTVVGSVFSNVISMAMIVATAATLYAAAVRAGLPGVEIGTAEEAARALVPVAGPFASQLFGAGIFGASMLAAGVLPLATALSVCEAFGWERGLSQRVRDAPVFYGLLTVLFLAGAVVALLPGLPVIRLLLLVQVVNGAILPVLLVFITRMASDREMMGRHANGRWLGAFAWLITGAVATLALAMVVSTVVLPLFGLSPEG
jgi:NRAMP (natural resistance-associated macrophage protein)-like metal ion transporter